MSLALQYLYNIFRSQVLHILRLLLRLFIESTDLDEKRLY